MSKSSIITSPETEDKSRLPKSDSKETLLSFFPDKTKKFEFEEFSLEKMLVNNSLSQNYVDKNILQYGKFYNICFFSFENNKIALKIPKMPNDWKDIEHEARMTYFAQQVSKRVVNFKNVFFSGRDYSLCLEYTPSLQKLLYEAQKQLSWRIRLSIALEVAIGLKELHEHGIFHNQIKSRHVLFDEKIKVIKLTDFSHAQFEGGKISLKCSDLSRDTDYVWQPPEYFKDEALSSASDVYGFGNFLYELATRSPLFATSQYYKIQALKRAGKTIEIPQECPLRVKQLIQSCWSVNPNERPNAAELIKRLKGLLSLLPKDTCEIDHEISVLNTEFSQQCRLTFFMGFHKRVGQDSALLPLSQNELFDKNLLPTIFDLSA